MLSSLRIKWCSFVVRDAMDRRSAISISRTNPVGLRGRSCLRAMRQGASRRTSPSCRCFCRSRNQSGIDHSSARPPGDSHRKLRGNRRLYRFSTVKSKSPAGISESLRDISAIFANWGKPLIIRAAYGSLSAKIPPTSRIDSDAEIATAPFNLCWVREGHWEAGTSCPAEQQPPRPDFQFGDGCL